MGDGELVEPGTFRLVAVDGGVRLVCPVCGRDWGFDEPVLIGIAMVRAVRHATQSHRLYPFDGYDDLLDGEPPE